MTCIARCWPGGFSGFAFASMAIDTKFVHHLFVFNLSLGLGSLNGAAHLWKQAVADIAIRLPVLVLMMGRRHIPPVAAV